MRRAGTYPAAARPAWGLVGWLFLLCALPVLLAVASGVPFHQVPDEGSHAVRASGLARGTLIGRNRPFQMPDGSVVISGASEAYSGLATVAFSFVEARGLADKQVTRAMLDRDLAQRWGDPAFLPTNNTSGNPPVFYLGSALGLKLGKAFGLWPFVSLYLARLVNVIIYITLGLSAITIARGLRPVLLVMLLLPTSLWLGGSISQDGPMIAACALATALLSRVHAPWGWRYWSGGALVGCVIMAKPVYVPLGVAMLLVGWSDRRLWPWRRLSGLAVACVPPILWFLTSRAIATGPMIRAPFKAGPLWPGTPGQAFYAVDVGANLQVLLADPWRFITIPWQTITREWDFIFLRMIQGLGASDLGLPDGITTLWVWAMAAACIAAILLRPRDPRPMPFAGLIMLAVVACTILFVYLGLYLTWTYTGEPLVEGVQGRYFIPVLMIAALGLPSLSIRFGQIGARLFALPAVALGLAGIVVMPATIVFAYYLR